jgi:hypothetical protein
MDRRAFTEYMNRLEQQVIVKGLERGIFGNVIWLPIRNGKLHSEPFAELLGTRFFYAKPAVIDYYGLHKRSTGFMTKAVRLGTFLSGFEAPLVPFSAVHDAEIKALCPELLHDFSDFKAQVIKARFPKGEE